MSHASAKENSEINTATPTANCSAIITKEFLQNVLKIEAKSSNPVPEIVSHSVTLGTKPGENYASIIYSVDIHLSDGTRRHLLIKCYPNNPSRQHFTNNFNFFFKECDVYSKWIPELRRMQTEVLGLSNDEVLDLPYAKFLHGECIDFQSEEGKIRLTGKINSIDNFIVMEDLRKTHGFRMNNRLQPFDLDHMKLAVAAFARVHALSWAYRHHVEKNITEKFPCLVTHVSDEGVAIWNDVTLTSLKQAKGIYDKEFGPGNDYSAAVDKFCGMVGKMSNFFTGHDTAEGLDKLMRITLPDPAEFGKDAENPEPWRIICHGDCNNNNMLFRYDAKTGKPLEIALVDLQLPHETCVVHDLQYLFFVSTTLEFRRKHLDNLLLLYHDTFNTVCVKLRTPTLPGFCMDSLRFRFHRAKFFGYYMAMMVLPIALSVGEVADMENIEEGKDLTEAFIEQFCDNAGANNLLKERLVEITRGMIEDGVF